MKHLLAVAILLAGTAIAHANHIDDYLAKTDSFRTCAIKQSTAALKRQTGKLDTEAAQEIAAKHCKLPKGLTDDDLETLGDDINSAVMDIADSLRR